MEIECGCPTKEEINNAVRQQRSGKDAGPDNISKEALKAGVGVKVDILYIFFAPKEYNERYIIKKKGGP